MVHAFLLKTAYWAGIFIVGVCFGIGIAVASGMHPLLALALGLAGAAVGAKALRGEKTYG